LHVTRVALPSYDPAKKVGGEGTTERLKATLAAR
jgi:hypothetical protein